MILRLMCRSHEGKKDYVLCYSVRRVVKVTYLCDVGILCSEVQVVSCECYLYDTHVIIYLSCVIEGS